MKYSRGAEHPRGGRFSENMQRTTRDHNMHVGDGQVPRVRIEEQ